MEPATKELLINSIVTNEALLGTHRLHKSIILQQIAKTALGINPETDITHMSNNDRLTYLELLRDCRDFSASKSK